MTHAFRELRSFPVLVHRVRDEMKYTLIFCIFCDTFSYMDKAYIDFRTRNPFLVYFNF